MSATREMVARLKARLEAEDPMPAAPPVTIQTLSFKRIVSPYVTYIPASWPATAPATYCGAFSVHGFITIRLPRGYASYYQSLTPHS